MAAKPCTILCILQKCMPGVRRSSVCCAEQISVQPPTSAANVALPASAAARRAAAPCCCGAGRAAIDRYILPAGPTAANPPHDAATGERDGQTDRRTAYRFIDAARYSVRVERVKRLTERYSRRHDDTDQHQTAQQQITNQPTAVTPRWTLFH